MTGYDFVQWFSGVLDMNPNGLDAAQIATIREKMSKVRSPAQFAADSAAAGEKKDGGLVARC